MFKKKDYIIAAFILFVFFYFLALNAGRTYALTYKKYIGIKAEGLVSNPGIYKLPRGSRLSDFLQQIWPPLPTAYLGGTLLYRKQLQIDEKVELIGIKREILHLKGLSIKVKDEIKRQFAALRPSGRLVIHAEYPVFLLNTKENIRLKNGDAIIFKPRPVYVFVEGAVKNPGKYLWTRNMAYSTYLNKANGLRNNAVHGFLYIIRAGGKIEKISSRFVVWNKNKKRWEFALFEKSEVIKAGDTLFIPFNYGKITPELTGLILAIYKRTGVILKL
jgi:hypothetical protein